MTFTKLFSSITASTIWAAPDQTRIVWITMLAMADQYGRIWASIPGLANIARVSIEACEAALVELQSPDKYSRTTEHDGRRIEPIDGGWRLLNHAKYREIRDEESIKESKRRYINKRRAAERGSNVDKDVETVEQCRTDVERCRPNTEADTDTEAYKHPSSTPDGFDLFWQAYPKKVSKPAAKRAFNAAKINGHLSEVIGDIEAKKASADWQKENGQFIPNPATYLNQRRWEDEIASSSKQTFGFV